MTAGIRQHVRMAAAARAFVLLAMFVPVLWHKDHAGIAGLSVIGVLWTLTTSLDWNRRLPVLLVATVDAAVVGVVTAVVLPHSTATLAALVVAPLTAGLYRSTRGVAYTLTAEMLALLLVCWQIVGHLGTEHGFEAFSWALTGLGLGLVGVFLHSALPDLADPLAPYHYAQSLIRQLIDISGGLHSGLDPVVLGEEILGAVRDDLPTSALMISIPRGDTLIPLVTKAMGAIVDFSACEDIAVEAWAVGLPVLHDHVFAFPLNTEAGTTAVVAGVLSARVDPARIGVEDRIRKLMRRMGPSAVHLDTALLFGAFRDAATSQERKRLAREMHDGVAQDIASLGYVVDALRVGVTDPEQAERVDMLRDRITKVVAEIRRSVVTLRTSVGQSESLGAAIGSIARNLSEVSNVPIHVTLDEHTQRLRPEVEAELFRIAQEAMNNAVRHAQASVIDVHCQVHAPRALITVTDNGRGLQAARPTSHGLHIMKERALLIGATLEIGETAIGGLSVSVRLPASPAGSDDSQSDVHEKVTA